MGHNIFSGIPKVIPVDNSARAPREDEYDESEEEYAEPDTPVAAEGADGEEFGEEELDEIEDLELPDTGSLTNISLKRDREGMAKPAAAPAPTRAAEQLPPSNLAEYWHRLRRGRKWPQKSDVDIKQIRLHWPNTVLMRCATADQGWGFESLYSEVVRGGGQNYDTGEIEFTDAMVMEWLLSMGKSAQTNGAPVEDTDTFPTLKGDRRYKARAVPLSDDEATINYVLCHVERV